MEELGNSATLSGEHGEVQRILLAEVGGLLKSAYKNLKALEAVTKEAQGIWNVEKQAKAYRDKVFTACKALRDDIDALEAIMPRDLWPVPVYSDLLFKL
jgi:glutamine synthetase